MNIQFGWNITQSEIVYEISSMEKAVCSGNLRVCFLSVKLVIKTENPLKAQFSYDHLMIS